MNKCLLLVVYRFLNIIALAFRLFRIQFGAPVDEGSSLHALSAVTLEPYILSTPAVCIEGSGALQSLHHSRDASDMVKTPRGRGVQLYRPGPSTHEL